MKKGLGWAMALAYSLSSYAQTDSTKKSQLVPNVTFSGFADVYYGYDFSHPSSHKRPWFLYNHTRHNEVNLNLGYLKAAYASEKVHANLAIMAGTYAQYNYAAEQELMKHVYEANIGIKLLKQHQLWLDAGVFTSHIGFESAVSKDCWTLTRSMVAENSPYYLSGAKLTYTTQNDKWVFLLAYVNGWQRIQRVPGQNNPNFSTQVQFKASNRLLLNYSTFIGSDKPDTAQQLRYYNNLYAVWQISNKLGLIAGFDYGLEQASKGSTNYNTWYVPTAILRYAWNDKWSAAARYEHYQDTKGVIIATGTPNGFQTNGYSLNVDFKPEKSLLVRVEYRLFQSKDDVFENGDANSSTNSAITSSFAISF